MNSHYKPHEGRWTAKKKHKVILDLKRGVIAPPQAKSIYGLSDEELMRMAHAYNTRGRDGLKIKNCRP